MLSWQPLNLQAPQRLMSLTDHLLKSRSSADFLHPAKVGTFRLLSPDFICMFLFAQFRQLRLVFRIHHWIRYESPVWYKVFRVLAGHFFYNVGILNGSCLILDSPHDNAVLYVFILFLC